MIKAYAPASSAGYEIGDQFYDDIVRAMADSDSKYKIIAGDFNAQVDTRRKENDFEAWERSE